jgi:hypothetical protein
MNTFAMAGLIMGAAALAGGIAYWSRQAQKKRREALEQLAVEMRWSFSSEGDDSLLSSLRGFHLFSKGHSKRLKNLLRGQVRDTSAAVFDYQYTTGGGKNRHASYHTVLCLTLGGRPLPRFSLRPERVFDKIGDIVGYRDIDFESHPAFSKKYFLRGDDEMAIRNLFGAGLISLLEQESGLCMEGEADRILIYRQRGRLKPEEIRPFLQIGERILPLLR